MIAPRELGIYVFNWFDVVGSVGWGGSIDWVGETDSNVGATCQVALTIYFIPNIIVPARLGGYPFRVWDPGSRTGWVEGPGMVGLQI